MLKMFGLEHQVDKLLGGQANTLSNVLTLSHVVHKAFDRFGIWLEEIPGQVRFSPKFLLLHDKAVQLQENTYKVEMAENEREVLGALFPRPASCVTFKVDPDCAAFCKENGTALPELPSRDLIGLRAACARVAHMSGAAEQIGQIIEMKRTQQLWRMMAVRTTFFPHFSTCVPFLLVLNVSRCNP